MTSKFDTKPISLWLYRGSVSCIVENNILLVVGPLAAIDIEIPSTLQITVKDDQLWVASKSRTVAMQTSNLESTLRIRQIILNALKGVSEGFVKEIELVGVGYRAFLSSGKLAKEMKELDTLWLKIGYSNVVEVPLPPQVRVSCVKPNLVSIFGLHKQDVHHLAAHIRNLVKVDPYKGKGLIYVHEQIRRKEGKKH